MSYLQASLLVWGMISCISIAGIFILLAMFRVVVSTNMVHIVQSKKKTTPYGTGQEIGNVYYAWPSWVPHFGVTVIELPVSNFDITLLAYAAYDADRVPFMVDVTAFFRIFDTAKAAQRVANIKELKEQLTQIVQGAVRKVLASDRIDAIMLERSKFGSDFTKEVEDQLKEWGVAPVKSMELMDIRDAEGSEVIANIMAKKISYIDMESRKEVAKNKKEAETSEIEAKREIDLQKQQALETVGKRTADASKEIGISEEMSKQSILQQQKATKTNEMDVIKVGQVVAAEIEKEKQIIEANQHKETKVIKAEGVLQEEQKNAQAIKVLGEARAEAEKLMQLAPVQAQIVLAEEIGDNKSYQEYLISIEKIKAGIVVGTEQAKALQKADVKIISNAGNAIEGSKNVMDVFTSKGGTNLAAGLEAFAQSELGKAFVDKFVTTK